MSGKVVFFGEAQKELRGLEGCLCLVTWRSGSPSGLQQVPAVVTRVSGMLAASQFFGDESPQPGDLVVVQVFRNFRESVLFRSWIIRAEEWEFGLRWPEEVRLVG